MKSENKSSLTQRFASSLVEGGDGDDILSAFGSDWFTIQGPITADVFWADAVSKLFMPDYSVYSDSIRVQGWQLGQLGLTMTGSIAPPTLTPLIGQDGYSDALTGSGGADQILGLSGNDALDGSAGDDVLDGGLGDDLIGGGAGSDLIYGGAGKDMILSATGLNLPGHLGQNGEWAPPAGAGAVWSQGRVWGVFESIDANGLVYIIDGGGSLSQDSAADIVFADDGDDYLDGSQHESHLLTPLVPILACHTWHHLHGIEKGMAT